MQDSCQESLQSAVRIQVLKLYILLWLHVCLLRTLLQLWKEAMMDLHYVVEVYYYNVMCT